jgi:Zn-dependent protease/CBS domain-containing protein
LNTTFRLGRVFGISIEVHISWLIVVALFSLTLARTYFPGVLPGLPPETYWTAGILTTAVIFASILAHELAHSLAAIREGISIKRIVLFIFGGVAQMEMEPDRPVAELKITAAGPLTSLAIAFFLGAIYFLLLSPGIIFSQALFFVARLNLILAVFNLLPAFPLDGGRLLRSAIWHFSKNLLRATRIAVAFGSLFSFLAMGAGFLLILVEGTIWGLWYIILGWMIYQAGQSSYSQLVFRQTFAGIKVAEIMSANPRTIPPDLNLQHLAEQFMEHKFGAFPVFYGSSTHGLVSINQLKEVPREKWPFTSVVSIMTPLKECVVIGPQADAAEIMMKMAAGGEGRALVMEEGRLVGILSRTDMMRFMQMHMILGAE